MARCDSNTRPRDYVDESRLRRERPENLVFLGCARAIPRFRTKSGSIKTVSEPSTNRLTSPLLGSNPNPPPPIRPHAIGSPSQCLMLWPRCRGSRRFCRRGTPPAARPPTSLRCRRSRRRSPSCHPPCSRSPCSRRWKRRPAFCRWRTSPVWRSWEFSGPVHCQQFVLKKPWICSVDSRSGMRRADTLQSQSQSFAE